MLPSPPSRIPPPRVCSRSSASRPRPTTTRSIPTTMHSYFPLVSAVVLFGDAESGWAAVAPYFWDLLSGAGWTVLISVLSMGLAVLLGLPIALGRLYGPAPLRWLAL